MVHNIYSVYDKVADAFMGNFESQNDATAIRAFKNACDSDGQIGQNPKDYVLYKLALFDEHNGTFEQCINKLQDGKHFTEKESLPTVNVI